MSDGGGLLRDDEGRLRSGWRLLLFLLLALALQVLGSSLLALVPLPEERLATVVRTGVTLAAAIGAGLLLLRTLDQRPPGALGFHLTRSAGPEMLWGLGVGAAILVAVLLPMAATGLVAFSGDTGTLGGWAATLTLGLAFLAIPAAAEEAVFRGYPFQVVTEGLGPAGATLLFSGLFAVGHANNPNVGWIALVNIGLAGVLLSVVYLRSRSLWAATGVHLGWNWAMAVAFDMPVSGLELVDTPLYDVAAVGPSWITGGAFGPEAGLAGTVAFVLGMVLVLKLPAFREAEGVRRTRPLVDRRLRSRDELALEGKAGGLS